MADFDTSRNHFIEKGEFVNGMLRWLDEAKRTVTSGAYSKKFLNDFHAVCFFYQLFCCRVDLSWKDKFQHSQCFREQGMNKPVCSTRMKRKVKLMEIQPGLALRPSYFCFWELQWQQHLQILLLMLCTISQMLHIFPPFSSPSL